MFFFHFCTHFLNTNYSHDSYPSSIKNLPYSWYTHFCHTWPFYIMKIRKPFAFSKYVILYCWSYFKSYLPLVFDTSRSRYDPQSGDRICHSITCVHMLLPMRMKVFNIIRNSNYTGSSLLSSVLMFNYPCCKEALILIPVVAYPLTLHSENSCSPSLVLTVDVDKES